MLEKTGKESRFVNGLRYTDEETMDIVQSVLCGKVNKDLVKLINDAGGKAVGLSGMDDNMIQAVKLDKGDGCDYGLVGEIEDIDPEVIFHTIGSGMIPVISTVAMGTDGNKCYNINADTAAARIAIACHASKLILLTDITGVLRDRTTNPPSSGGSPSTTSRNSRVRRPQGGMIPKVNAVNSPSRTVARTTSSTGGSAFHPDRSPVPQGYRDHGLERGGQHMTSKELMALDRQYVLGTYGRNPIAIDHGKGATVYDPEGNEYIDFTSGIGVNSLGYGNEKWAKAIYDQALKLGHMSNLYYTEPCAKLAEQLCTRTGMSAVFRQLRRGGQRRHHQTGPEIQL